MAEINIWKAKADERKQHAVQQSIEVSTLVPATTEDEETMFKLALELSKKQFDEEKEIMAALRDDDRKQQREGYQKSTFRSRKNSITTTCAPVEALEIKKTKSVYHSSNPPALMDVKTPYSDENTSIFDNLTDKTKVEWRDQSGNELTELTNEPIDFEERWDKPRHDTKEEACWGEVDSTPLGGFLPRLEDYRVSPVKRDRRSPTNYKKPESIDSKYSLTRPVGSTRHYSTEDNVEIRPWLPDCKLSAKPENKLMSAKPECKPMGAKPKIKPTVDLSSKEKRLSNGWLKENKSPGLELKGGFAEYLQTDDCIEIASQMKKFDESSDFSESELVKNTTKFEFPAVSEPIVKPVREPFVLDITKLPPCVDTSVTQDSNPSSLPNETTMHNLIPGVRHGSGDVFRQMLPKSPPPSDRVVKPPPGFQPLVPNVSTMHQNMPMMQPGLSTANMPIPTMGNYPMYGPFPYQVGPYPCILAPAPQMYPMNMINPMMYQMGFPPMFPGISPTQFLPLDMGMRRLSVSSDPENEVDREGSPLRELAAMNSAVFKQQEHCRREEGFSEPDDRSPGLVNGIRPLEVPVTDSRVPKPLVKIPEKLPLSYKSPHRPEESGNCNTNVPSSVAPQSASSEVSIGNVSAPSRCHPSLRLRKEKEARLRKESI